MKNNTSDSAFWWRDDPDTERQGFGVVLHAKGDNWVVDRTLQGSPAELANVRRGDIVHAISGQQIGKSFRRTKLTAIIDILERSTDHDVAFRRGNDLVVVKMRPQVLRELIEHEMTLSNTTATYCYSCPNCYFRTAGAAQCSDCPTSNCTVG